MLCREPEPNSEETGWRDASQSDRDDRAPQAASIVTAEFSVRKVCRNLPLVHLITPQRRGRSFGFDFPVRRRSIPARLCTEQLKNNSRGS